MDPNELVNRAEQERIQIFQRYKKGRTKDAEIDSWEDPEFSVYFQTDRYGFIHDQKLPLAVDPNEKKLKSIEMERVNKWLKMLKNWDTKQTKEKMHKRVHKGIPDKLRSKVWAQLLNLEKVMKDPKNKNKYQEMLVLAQKYSTEARQIDSDVNRQFRDHIIYRERYNIKQQSLFNVLVAYSMYNMEVGYCQGMSTLAGMLLMYMDEEESFWGLSILLSDKKFAMHGLFIVGFPKLSRFLAHHDQILTKFLPKVKKHFDSCNLDSILYSLKWFFVVFVERIPFALCLRVWDIYLMDGEKVVTAMAYTILRLHKNKLLKLRDMDSIVHFLQVKLQHDFGFSDDFVIKMLEQCSDELRKAKLDLPATATEIELPQKPFGVFVEPTKEEKIGHRKSDFTSIEKEVTETVLLKRELTAIELANDDNHLEEIGLCGSNSQLNTVQISEDGGSLLGSSKRSLADTSVTSTADLSVFSGTGQRSMSQQHNDFGFDNSLITNDNNNLNSSDIDLHIMENNNNNNRDDDDEDEDVENGESSPNSVAKSTSTIQIYQKPVSKMDEALSIENSSMTYKENITPTPTNISPQDIVRIYVPPADPVELREQKVRADDEISQSSRRSSIIRLEYDITPLESSPPHRSRNASQPHSPQSYRGEQVTTSNKQHNDKSTYSPTSDYNGSTSGTFNKSQPQQYYYPAQPTTQPYPNYQSSSSRRGSMTRKTPSPMLDTELIIMECDHMKMRRSQENLNQDFSITYSVNGGTNKSNNSSKVYQFNNSSSNSNSNNNNNNGESLKRLTSFEELAKKSESNSLMYIQQQSNSAQSVDNNPRRYSASNNKPKSDYNIHYKNLNSHDDEIDEYAGISHQNLIKKSTSHSYNIRKNERKSSSETNSPFDYDLLKEKRKVDRFMYDDDTENKPMETTEKSIKLYDRFFNSEDEEEEEESETRVAKKSSSTKYRSHIISGTEGDDDDENDDENSSNSPPNKSLLSSPIIETIPLLMSSEPDASTALYQLPPVSSPPSANSSSFRGSSKIPRYHKSSNSNNDSFRKTSSISSPEEEDRSEGLNYNKYESRLAQSFGGGGNSYQSPSSTIRSSSGAGGGAGSSSRKNSTSKSDNKIRIKINQKN